jgi:hypothetical protein
MSFNDRCGEAAEVLAHGGTIPPDGIAALVDLLRDSRDTCAAPRDLVHAILRDPANAHLAALTSDGEWHGTDEGGAS